MSDLAHSRPAAGGTLGIAGRRIWRYAFPAALIVLLTFLVLYPLGMLVFASFVDSPPRPGSPVGNFTLQNFASLAEAGNLRAIRNSLVFSVVGSGLALIIGGAMAWLVARSDAPFKPFIAFAGVAPLFMSSLVGALAYALIASPRSGYINLLLRDVGIDFRFDIYSGGGIIFVFALFYAPYAFLFLSSALQLMNPELEEAAEAHGATRFEVLRTITFPLVQPALLGAGILTLVLTLENFPVPQVLGTPTGTDTMPSVIFRKMMTSPPRPTEAAATGMLLLVIMAALVYAQSRLLANRAFHTVAGKGFRPKLIPLGKWRWPAFAASAAYLFLSAFLPVFALFQAALRPHLFVPNFLALFDLTALSFTNIIATLNYGPFQDAFVNSLIVGVMTAIFGTTFHFVLSYYVNRTTQPWRTAIEQVAMMPVAIPALIIGMGFLWAWITLPVPIYGTLTILVLAYTARFMPQGYRAVSATILQVHRDLEDSAIISGASRVRAAFDILTPLIRPGVASAMFLLFLLSMRELSTSLFLFTAQTRVLAIVLYEQWETGSWSFVASISLLYSALLLVITVVGQRWIGLKSF
jgi:iron(III) transport system permease protein